MPPWPHTSLRHIISPDTNLILNSFAFAVNPEPLFLNPWLIVCGPTNETGTKNTNWALSCHRVFLDPNRLSQQSPTALIVSAMEQSSLVRRWWYETQFETHIYHAKFTFRIGVYKYNLTWLYRVNTRLLARPFWKRMSPHYISKFRFTFCRGYIYQVHCHVLYM